MYPYVLGLHNIVRWVVLLAGAWAVGLVWSGWVTRRRWTTGEARASRIFVGALDAQVLVGVLLYAVFSPLTRQGFRDFGGAMHDAPVRYFLLEHPLIMVFAVVVAHVGMIQVRRSSTDGERFQWASILLGLAFAAVVGFIPWARPLIPSF